MTVAYYFAQNGHLNQVTETYTRVTLVAFCVQAWGFIADPKDISHLDKMAIFHHNNAKAGLEALEQRGLTAAKAYADEKYQGLWRVCLTHCDYEC